MPPTTYVVLLAILTIFILGIMAIDNTSPCEHFNNNAIKDVPARCADYYHLTK